MARISSSLRLLKVLSCLLTLTMPRKWSFKARSW